MRGKNTARRRPLREPRVVAALCLATKRGSFAGLHQQPCDAFYLIEDGATCAGIESRRLRTGRHTLILVRRGEPRGYWNIYGEAPRIWAIYFIAPRSLYAELAALREPDPVRRVWDLSTEEAAQFTTLFIRLAAENAAGRQTSRIAASSWLKLLLVGVQRWHEHRKAGDSAWSSIPPVDPIEERRWTATLLERSTACTCA